MTITKFDSAAPPSFVTQDFFQTGVPGWILQLTDGNMVRLFNGDLIIQDNGVIRYISAADYAAIADSAQDIKEGVGKELLRNMWKTLAASGLTDAVKASILSTVSVTLIACLAGEVRAAKIIATATATTADFTTARKNAMIALIDAAILKL